MLHKILIGTFIIVISQSAVLAKEAPSYKLHIDPVMALAGYANIQLDKAIHSSVSIGGMVWHLDDSSWGGFSNNQETSLGVRIDWFETGVFQKGWHSNAMIKGDWLDSDYARTRVKLTQTYQFVGADLFVNLGIGAQFILESGGLDDTLYSDYQSWMLPSWEFSVSRAF
jgi:hypothetical protein